MIEVTLTGRGERTGGPRACSVTQTAHPADRSHGHRTVERLLALIPRAADIPAASPESPRPEFAAVCAGFVATLVPYLR